MSLTLISHVLCPYVQRAVIALHEKAVPFKRIDIDLANKPDWFLRISPLGKTPVLQVEGASVFESAVICEYLEDTHAPSLHPADPLQRARHRAWIELSSATLNTVWNLYTARDELAYTASQQALRQRFVQLDAELGDGPYFAGTAFSLVDAAFAPVFRYFEVFDPVLEVDLFAALPKLQAWRAALAQRPSVAAAVGSDYGARLRDFVIKQQGVLGLTLHAA